jgi:hypothetical protein
MTPRRDNKSARGVTKMSPAGPESPNGRAFRLATRPSSTNSAAADTNLGAGTSVAPPAAVTRRTTFA